MYPFVHIEKNKHQGQTLDYGFSIIFNAHVYIQ